jgi:hypothetical protein
MLDQLPKPAIVAVITQLLCIRSTSVDSPRTSVAATLSQLRLVSRKYRDAVDEFRKHLRAALYDWCRRNGAALALPLHIAMDLDSAHNMSLFGLTCHAIHPKTPADIFPPSLILPTFCDCNLLDATFLMVFSGSERKPIFYCKVYVSSSIFSIDTERGVPLAILLQCPYSWWDNRNFNAVLDRI